MREKATACRVYYHGVFSTIRLYGVHIGARNHYEAPRSDGRPSAVTSAVGARVNRHPLYCGDRRDEPGLHPDAWRRSPRCIKRIRGSRIVTSPSRMLTNRLGRGSTRTMTIAAFEDRPPQSAQVTAYDERHFATYLRLLDADEEGADWREAVRIIFNLDPDREPERARMVHDSHLARARWMTQAGYRNLLRPRPH
jgi:Uncharacterized conserved protein (DUF2285)